MELLHHVPLLFLRFLYGIDVWSSDILRISSSLSLKKSPLPDEPDSMPEADTSSSAPIPGKNQWIYLNKKGPVKLEK